MNNEFKKKNAQQILLERAEISLQKAKELILEHIPNKEIQAIYVKGSYIQGELKEDSDIDIVVILKTKKYLPDVYKLTDDFGNTTDMPFQAVAYTMDELQTGVLAQNRTKSPTTISIFVKQLDQLPLIYGLKPEGKLYTRTDIKDLTAQIGNFRKMFLPDFEKGNFHFKSLVKQVLWLVEREQRALGILPEYSWQRLANSIKDPDHIVHNTLKYRRGGEVSDKEKDEYMNKLNEYLEMLGDKYKKTTNI